MTNSQKGFAPLVLLAIVIVVLVAGGGIYIATKSKSNQPVTQESIPTLNNNNQKPESITTNLPAQNNVSENSDSTYKLNSEILLASPDHTTISYWITKNAELATNNWNIKLSCPNGVTAVMANINGCESLANIIGAGRLDVKFKNSTSVPQVVTATAQLLSAKDNKTVIATTSFNKNTIYPSNSAPSTITVLYPNGGEIYKTGDTVNINWRSSNLNLGHPLSVHLSNDQGHPIKLIATLPAGSTNFIWKIDSTVSGGWYKITIEGDDYGFNLPVFDRSDSTFNILTITPPNN